MCSERGMNVIMKGIDVANACIYVSDCTYVYMSVQACDRVYASML